MKSRTTFALLIIVFLLALTTGTYAQNELTYPIVDTDQSNCYSDNAAVNCGTVYTGQDAQYTGNQPSYRNNGDGTVTDLTTGLMWQQDPGGKVSYAQATAGANALTLAGYDDWRLPTIKELYSLILFSGVDASNVSSSSANLTPFIDTDYFNFKYGDESGGARVIDSQWATSTVYNVPLMNNQTCFFGVNFADGRIKCYPTNPNGGNGGYFALYVRGDSSYGVNDFVDNGNGTITDNATGLTWMQNDSGNGLLWGDAMAYCEALTLAGSDDWRLPNAKELQSIVDYSRSPDGTNSAAIDPLFNATPITNEAGEADYATYWTSTTHAAYPDRVTNAVSIAFGRALGNMDNYGGWVDIHGAGAQRSDPKAGISAQEAANGRGPQGDAVRSDNAVRCVRDDITQGTSGDPAPAVVNTQTNSTSPSQPAAQPNTANSQPAQPPTNTNTNQSSVPEQPPAEAVNACNGQPVNNTCSFQSPQGTVSGTCQPVAEQVACVPSAGSRP